MPDDSAAIMPELVNERPSVWCDQGPSLPYQVPEYPYEGWNPYCMPCAPLIRMVRKPFGWECPRCLNAIGPDLVRRVGPFARVLEAHDA